MAEASTSCRDNKELAKIEIASYLVGCVLQGRHNQENCLMIRHNPCLQCTHSSCIPSNVTRLTSGLYLPGRNCCHVFLSQNSSLWCNMATMLLPQWQNCHKLLNNKKKSILNTGKQGQGIVLYKNTSKVSHLALRSRVLLHPNKYYTYYTKN